MEMLTVIRAGIRDCQGSQLRLILRLPKSTTMSNKISIFSLNHELKFPVFQLFALIISFAFHTLTMYVFNPTLSVGVANPSGFMGVCGIISNPQLLLECSENDKWLIIL